MADVSGIFLHEGVLGACAVAEAAAIVYLFKALAKSWRERIEEGKEQTRVNELNAKALDGLADLIKAIRPNAKRRVR